MLTGRAPFAGKTQANVIASILAAEPPPVTSFQPLIPPALEHLIKTCLAKDPADRRQNMHDVLLELKWIAESGSQVGIARPVAVRRKRRERLSWAVAAVAIAAAAVLAFLHLREKPAESYAVRFEQPLPAKVRFRWYDMPAVSPDGRQIVFPGAALAGKGVLWLRRLDSSQLAPLTGTESSGAQFTADTTTPFWSPDSRFIGYLSDGKLRKVDAGGGPSQVLCDLLPGSYGGAWSRQGIILIGRWNGPVYQVSAAGGEPKPILKLEAARKERGQFAPQFLPGGRHFIYTSASSEPGKSGIYLGSLDGKESRLLVATDSNSNFVPPGYLLFARGQALMAQPFDAGKLQLEGEPFPVADSVGRNPVFPLSAFSSSLNGTLVYRSETSVNLQLTWADRSGRRAGSVGEPRPYRQGNLSPDEKRVVLQITDMKLGTDDIWILDLTTGILSRLTSDPHTEDTPIWSPDGREVWFASNRGGRHMLYRKPVGGGDDELMLPSTEPNYPGQCLRDGSVLFMNLTGKSFFRLPPGAGAKPETLLKTEYSKDEPRVSPDGRWVAYNTNESGRWEVYIASFPGFTERRQVSNNGGVQGYWRKDGKELFYLALDGTMMSVEVKPGPPLEAGIPQALFQTRIPVGPTSDQFAVTGDGKRFLLLESSESDEKPLSIVLNWPALVKK